MNSRLKIQVKVPMETAVNFKFSTVGMQDSGAMPKLDLMDRPTPKATTTSPRVEIPYRTRMLLAVFIT